MLVYAQEAVALMRDRSRTDLDTDRTLGLAILRCVEIVGEAAGPHPCYYPTALYKDPVAANHRYAQSTRPRL